MKIIRPVQEIQHLHNSVQKWINIENKGIKKKKIVGTYHTTQEAQFSALWWPRWLGWGGRRLDQEGGDICIHIADWLHCTTDTGTTL